MGRWPDGVPPDITGMFITGAIGLTIVAWFARTPESLGGLLVLALPSAMSLAAWAAAMALTAGLGPIVRVWSATVASAGSVALVLATRGAGWLSLILLALTIAGRLERPPGRRTWRHGAIAFAVALVVVVILDLG